MLKELNGGAVALDSAGTPFRSHPRVTSQPPSPRFHHPAGRKEVLRFIEAVGPVAIYGLRSVELVRAHSPSGVPCLVFGRYEAPGRILLFEQPVPPWRLPGLLDHESVRRFERAGATVTPRPDSGATLVDWPAGTLERFMLEEVLLHELGHHVLQHYKAKRPARIARTKDHEAFAALFAERQRQTLQGRQSQTP